MDFFSINLELMCCSSLDDTYLKVNNMFETLLGYTNQELENQPILSLVHPEDQNLTQDALNKAKHQAQANKYINRCICKDGSYRIIEWISLKKNNILFSTGRDITEEQKIQLELNKKNIQLKKLAKALKKTNKSLEEIAHVDKLTGLYNRNFFDKRIVKEMHESDKNFLPLSMILYDLDHFKNINDDYGHPVGDVVLKYYSAIVNQFIRKTDYAFRLGGEEFAILLHNTNLDKAAFIAEDIRTAFENNIHPVVGKITASFGVSQRNHNESFIHWYKKIDRALYVAKNKGRNQVVCYKKHMLPIASLSIDWNNSWNSGNEHIDSQHKDLLSLAMEINDLLYSDGSPHSLIKLIDTLIHHIEIHFSDEEKILEEYQYPDWKQHKQIHEKLTVQALKLQHDYIQKKLKASAIVTFLLDEVVMGHLLVEDIKFFPYFQNNTKGK